MSEGDGKILYAFDDFVLDPNGRTLQAGDEAIPLTSKAFDTLLVLVENSGRLVEKERLLDTVWADTFVEESTLAQNISTLRKAFAAHGSEIQFIETVPRHGYRFAREVERLVTDGDAYVIETRTRTRVLAETTEFATGSETVSRFFGLVTTRRDLVALVLAVSALAVAGGLYLWSAFSPPVEPFSAVSVREIASFGDIRQAALSPDGQFIAVVDAKDGLQSIRVKQVAGGREIEVLPPSKIEILGLTYSNDGGDLYYSAYPAADTASAIRKGQLFAIRALGGPATVIASDVDTPAGISPDGRSVAFVRNIPGEKKTQLISIPIKNSGDADEKVVAELAGEKRFAMTGPAWSPDGRRLSANVIDRGREKPMEIVAVNVGTGEIRAVADGSWGWAGRAAWTSDSGSLLFPAFRPESPNITDEVWIANSTNGKLRRIAEGVNGIFGVTISADSRKLIAVRSRHASALWVVPINGGAGSVIDKNFGDNSLSPLGIAWLPDGRIVYASALNGQADIFTANPAGGPPVQLTSDPAADLDPVVSPDGASIAFLSNRKDRMGLWMMKTDGSDVHEIASMRDMSSPSFSADGEWIYVAARGDESKTVTLWKIPKAGGSPFKLTDKPTFLPKASPDGKFIVGFYPAEGQPSSLVPTLISLNDLKVLKQFPEISVQPGSGFAWTPDSKAFTYLIDEHEVSNIWKQGLNGEAPQRVTNLDTDQIFRYAFSPDGSSIAIEKGLQKNDILLITNDAK